MLPAEEGNKILHASMQEKETIFEIQVWMVLEN